MAEIGADTEIPGVHADGKRLQNGINVGFGLPAHMPFLTAYAVLNDDLDLTDEALGPAVMSADLSVVCWDADEVQTAEYRRITTIAAVALVLYPVLLPIIYATLLFRVRTKGCP